MKILAIETSCDETAVSIVECSGDLHAPKFTLLAEVTVTQLDLHKAYGGVVPMLAKREHQRTLVPITIQALEKAGLDGIQKNRNPETIAKIEQLLEREPDLRNMLLAHTPEQFFVPDIDAIAVTHGPGLEPALWVGVNFARALAFLWEKPLIPVNHMAGHLYAGLLDTEMSFPALGLLVSGGHTELVHVPEIGVHKVIGKTRDDAVGEAFDKVARIMGLPYPGGPAIEKIQYEETSFILPEPLPRPMLHSQDFDFSYAGLKTAVLYLTKKLGDLTHEMKIAIAKEFTASAIETLLGKSKKATEEYSPKSFVIGGGVSASTPLRDAAKQMIDTHFPDTTLVIPTRKMSTDNATMIAIAGYIEFLKKGASDPSLVKAEGNLCL